MCVWPIIGGYITQHNNKCEVLHYFQPVSVKETGPDQAAEFLCLYVSVCLVKIGNFTTPAQVENSGQNQIT